MSKENITLGKWEAAQSPMGDWGITEGNELICRGLRHWNKDLILAAVNSCKAINPSNPMAVAENIEKMTLVLKSLNIEFAALASRLGDNPALNYAYHDSVLVLQAIEKK